VSGKYGAHLEVMFGRLATSADLDSESVALLHPRGGGWFDEDRWALRRLGIPFCELTRENEWPSGAEVLALCTMHSAKGLEFDHVLLPVLSQQVTPHGNETGDADLERLRRMLAMAIGRARKSVMIGFKPGEESSLIQLLDPSTYELVVA
jgi:UvrD-like helicase C-terminal domain